ncbi:MAG: hypothetical protein RL171_1756 [Pseudomonadota bacterium]
MQSAGHLLKTFQMMFGGKGSKWTINAGFAKVATVGAHVVGRLFIDIGVARGDEVFSSAVHEVEVVTGLVRFVVAWLAPVKTQPFDRVDDGVDVFHLLFFRVGVVKPQVAHAAVVARQAEVEADALGVADVQVAVGLGREAGADFGGVGLASGLVRGVARAARPAAAGVGAGGEVMLDDLAQEVAGFDCIFSSRGRCFVG